MKKSFVTNLALLLSLNLLIKPFWILGIDRAIQNQMNSVDTKEFGLYSALFFFTFLFNIVLDFGITNFNNKNIAQNNHLLTKHFSSLVVLKIPLAIAYIIVTVLVGFLIGYDVRKMQIILILGFNQFLISFIQYLRSNLGGLHLFKTDSIISVLDRLIMIPICAVFLWGHVTEKKIDLFTYIYIQTTAYFTTAVITTLIVLRKTHSFSFSWNWPFSLMILKKSFPYAILVLLMTFYNRIDMVILERILPEDAGAEQSGIYMQGYRLLDATNMIAMLLAGMLLPMFSRMLKYKESVEQLVKLSFTLLITPAIVIASGCFFYSNELMHMLYTTHADESAKVFSLLMTCFIAVSSTYIFGTLLTANGNLKELNIMATCGMLLNIALNLILIPKLFAYGSAIAALTTQFLTAITQILIVQKKFKFKINYRLLINLSMFIVGVIAFNVLSKNIHYNSQNWIPNFLAMVAFSIGWAFTSNLLNIKSMLRILKYG